MLYGGDETQMVTRTTDFAGEMSCGRDLFSICSTENLDGLAEERTNEVPETSDCDLNYCHYESVVRNLKNLY